MTNSTGPRRCLLPLRAAAGDPRNQSTNGLMRLAPLAAYFGDDELALRCLRRAYLEFGPQIPMHIWHPVLRKTRQTAEFQADCTRARDFRLLARERQLGRFRPAQGR